MGRFTVIASIVLAFVAAPFVHAQDKASEEVLKSKGLTKVGITYLLEGDIKLPEALRAMRLAKKTLDEDTKKRIQLENQIKQAKGFIATKEFEGRDLSEKLSRVKPGDAFENNKIVG